MDEPVFVFGSNLTGIHGAGAAKYARQRHGAIIGIGSGPQGNSYAIPTKRTPRETLSLDEIESYVRDFLDYARKHPELTFLLTAIGCGLAGYKPYQIAPMFKDAPTNVIKPAEFKP